MPRLGGTAKSEDIYAAATISRDGDPLSLLPVRELRPISRNVQRMVVNAAEAAQPPTRAVAHPQPCAQFVGHRHAELLPQRIELRIARTRAHEARGLCQIEQAEDKSGWS